jgi:hypothetical protein
VKTVRRIDHRIKGNPIFLMPALHERKPGE